MATEATLPPIPPKRYFTIGEVSDLCGVKPHVLRYWEQEFTQLRPMKRRGNRRYYQHHEVLMIRRIRELLYEEGFTIQGARNRLAEWTRQQRQQRNATVEPVADEGEKLAMAVTQATATLGEALAGLPTSARRALAAELRAIRDLLPDGTSEPAQAHGDAV
ncbi:MerR HTH family regulatory protein [Tepidimonas sediminis]|uniref:MerR HTH family regulatory protein n=1 Tax=Tepidimonas sediminis TaxID=2588941 RepID=A0A554WS97_9BURK|nr:MerR family transcriptional regulator [Tepidimonas sediminis]TSE26450.1 MerR HTH family regulatory protein [Tepidimonas sediminis]